MDNGKEFHAKALRRGADEYGKRVRKLNPEVDYLYESRKHWRQRDNERAQSEY